MFTIAAEVAMIPADDIYIGTRPPRSLLLVNSVTLRSNIHSVCHSDGKCYVGCIGSIVVIDGGNRTIRTWKKLPNEIVYGIDVYNDRVYALVRNEEFVFKVCVFDQSGLKIHEWIHSDICNKANTLVVVSNMVVVPNRQYRRLTVYSLDGVVIKYLLSGLSLESVVSLCKFSSDSLIVVSASRVLRVNILTNAVVWTFTSVHVTPRRVAMYGGIYAIVLSNCSDTSWVVDAMTGE